MAAHRIATTVSNRTRLGIARAYPHWCRWTGPSTIMFGPHWQVIIGVAKDAGCIKGPAPADQVAERAVKV